MRKLMPFIVVLCLSMVLFAVPSMACWNCNDADANASAAASATGGNANATGGSANVNNHNNLHNNNNNKVTVQNTNDLSNRNNVAVDTRASALNLTKVTANPNQGQAQNQAQNQSQGQFQGQGQSLFNYFNVTFEAPEPIAGIPGVVPNTLPEMAMAQPGKKTKIMALKPRMVYLRDAYGNLIYREGKPLYRVRYYPGYDMKGCEDLATKFEGSEFGFSYKPGSKFLTVWFRGSDRKDAMAGVAKAMVLAREKFGGLLFIVDDMSYVSDIESAVGGINATVTGGATNAAGGEATGGAVGLFGGFAKGWTEHRPYCIVKFRKSGDWNELKDFWSVVGEKPGPTEKAADKKDGKNNIASQREAITTAKAFEDGA